MSNTNNLAWWERIPTLLAVVIILAAVAGGVSYINDKKNIPISARENAMPYNVRSSNIESDSFTITWTTAGKSTGFLVWGINASTKNVILENTAKPAYNHSINLTNLEPNTTYFYRIYSEGIQFENNNIPWQARTAYNIPNTVKSFIISGVVTDRYGNPINNAIVYITAGGGSLLSELTTRNGSFVTDISRTKNQSLENFVKIDKDNTLIEIVVQGDPQNNASIQVYPKDAQPINPIIMGLSLNLKNPQNRNDFIPNSNVEMPR